MPHFKELPSPSESEDTLRPPDSASASAHDDISAESASCGVESTPLSNVMTSISRRGRLGSVLTSQELPDRKQSSPAMTASHVDRAQQQDTSNHTFKAVPNNDSSSVQLNTTAASYDHERQDRYPSINPRRYSKHEAQQVPASQPSIGPGVYSIDNVPLSRADAERAYAGLVELTSKPPRDQEPVTIQPKVFWHGRAQFVVEGTPQVDTTYFWDNRGNRRATNPWARNDLQPGQEPRSGTEGKFVERDGMLFLEDVREPSWAGLQTETPPAPAPAPAPPPTQNQRPRSTLTQEQYDSITPPLVSSDPSYYAHLQRGGEQPPE